MKTTLFIIALLCSVTNYSHAELSSKDFLAPNDGLLTVDSQTGLEWLDLSFTSMSRGDADYVNNSYDSVVSKTQDVNHVLHGFRHATAFEVEELFNNAGLYINPNEIKYQKGEPYGTPVQTEAFLELLSSTYKTSSVDALYGITGTRCEEISIFSCSHSGYSNDIAVASVALRKGTLTYASVVFEHVSSENYKNDRGHFLVRNLSN